MNQAITLELDLSGLTCPMPLLKTKQALNKLGSGDVVRVVATDPASERDFKVFADQSGNQLLSIDKADGNFIFVLRKS
jgi:tRNA 2-thiouridine synthesizing protein A